MPPRVRQELPPPQEHNAPEVATRVISSEIQEAGGNSGTTLS
jgi:hypothetical protein